MDPVFGNLDPLKVDMPFQLPNFLEVGKAIAFERAKRGMTREKCGNDKTWSNDEAYRKVCADLVKIYGLANIPTIPEKNIMRKIIHLWTVLKQDKLKEKVSISGKKKKGKGKKKETIEELKFKLFDLTDYKKLENLKKIKRAQLDKEGGTEGLSDTTEETFIEDQKTVRKRWVSGEDKEFSKDLMKK